MVQKPATVALLAAVASGFTSVALADNGVWGELAPALKQLDLVTFCTKHRGDTRCKDLEALRAFCAAHPMDAERCDRPSAAKLLQQCDSDSSTDHAACAGVLDAMIDSGAAPQLKPSLKLDAPEPALACVPVAVLNSPDQLRILFVREAYRHPEVLHLPARRLLYYALAKTFPCANPLKIKPE